MTGQQESEQSDSLQDERAFSQAWEEDPRDTWQPAGVHLVLSDDPSDWLRVRVDRERRRITIEEPNGAELLSVVCPLLMAGGRRS